MRNYARCLIALGRPHDQIGQALADLMTEAGFDPADLWPQIFGDGSDSEQADAT